MPTDAAKNRTDSLLDFVGALVKEHASLPRDDPATRPILNRKPAKRTESLGSTRTLYNSDRT